MQRFQQVERDRFRLGQVGRLFGEVGVAEL